LKLLAFVQLYSQDIICSVIRKLIDTIAETTRLSGS